MPSDLALKTMNAVHKAVLTLSGGRLGWHVAGMPALELTTTGRRSGQSRTVMLTFPVQRGDAIVIVASRGGDDNAPGWFHNLVDHPDVSVAYGGEPARPMRARVANEEERSELWPLVTAKYRSYATYQTKTSRVIPLVFLEPITTR
jgi:deazaflavin-dependent oxidoreductase (nitroreductase family)